MAVHCKLQGPWDLELARTYLHHYYVVLRYYFIVLAGCWWLLVLLLLLLPPRIRQYLLFAVDFSILLKLLCCCNKYFFNFKDFTLQVFFFAALVVIPFLPSSHSEHICLLLWLSVYISVNTDMQTQSNKSAFCVLSFTFTSYSYCCYCCILLFFLLLL